MLAIVMSCALLSKLENFGGDVVKFNENEELSFFMAEMKKIKKMYSLVRERHNYN